MRRRTVLIAILAGALAAFGALAAACGDGDGESLTLEEYFARFEAIDADVDQQVEALFADFPDVSDEEFFSNEENLPLLKSIFAGFPRILGDALDELDGLDPPSEVEDAHNEFLEAGRGLLAAFESAASDVEDVETIAEAQEIGESADAEVAPAEQRFDEACLALVDVGAANGLVVDVDCEDDE